MTLVAPPEPGPRAAESFVREHLGDVLLPGESVAASARFTGGQRAADRALAEFEPAGYAENRHTVYPQRERRVSALSPYIRHGLLSLPEVWGAVADGCDADVVKFRTGLLRQEYARHWYAHLGARTSEGVLRRQSDIQDWNADWDSSMACVELSVGELEDDGWLVNQDRMWLAAQWTTRHRGRWQDGEDYLFRHLLDGSRAANRLGWQWAAGVGSSRAYSFSRWQVEERAAGLCSTCERVYDCPIEHHVDEPRFDTIEQPVAFRRRAAGEAVAESGTTRDHTGPATTLRRGAPDTVWLTAESLSRRDPALVANPDLPAVFVFDHALLARLKLSSKRLVFLVETLAELATIRVVEFHIGDPVAVLADRLVAVTHAPVPGFARRAGRIAPVEVHPWPWLCRPSGERIQSFGAWRRDTGLMILDGRRTDEAGPETGLVTLPAGTLG